MQNDETSPNEGCIITILVQENIYRVTGTCNSSFLFAIVDMPQFKDRDETVLYCLGLQIVYEAGHYNAAELAFWLMFWKLSPLTWSGDCGGMERRGLVAGAKVPGEPPVAG